MRVRVVRHRPRLSGLSADELAADVVNDYKVNGKRSFENVERSLRLHLQPFFTGRKAAAITTTDIREYVTKRQEEKAKNATINRELALLKRAFSLGMEAGKLTAKPKIRMLREDNVQTGFFEPAQFEGVRGHLPEALQAVVTFAHVTGWRTQSEVLPLQWRQVDFTAGRVRLDPGTTKNGDGRVFPMTQELRTLLLAQREYSDAIQRKTERIIPYVFHRNGRRILLFYKAWRNACKAAGCPDRILHDFRRTAVRNLVRNGIPERVAMQMTGHKTRSVFDRYNIVSESDLIDAARKLDEAAGTVTGTKTAIGGSAGNLASRK